MANDLIALIRAKQAEIAKLQAELDEAKALLAGTGPRPTSARQPVVQPIKITRDRKGRIVDMVGMARGSDVLPENSAAYWAAKAIQEAGKPLHARDIVTRLEQQGQEVKMLTLVGSLSRWVKRKVFYRAGPNVFGLMAMRDA